MILGGGGRWIFGDGFTGRDEGCGYVVIIGGGGGRGGMGLGDVRR